MERRAGIEASRFRRGVPDPTAILGPDATAEPGGFVVEVGPGERIHFLDWGGPVDADAGASGPGAIGVLLVHGLSGSAWSWAAVARRLRRVAPTVAMDLRGHGLSDAPTTGYEPERLAEDVLAVAEGSGLVDWAEAPAAAVPDAAREVDVSSAADGAVVVAPPLQRRIVLVGHGFGGMVAAWAAAELGARCAGLVLVDGGWQDLAMETGLSPAEFLVDLAEPPEVLRSMDAYLADRIAWDPASWTADEERAVRATVVEVPAGRVVPAVRPHALERSVEAMFAYRPATVLGRLGVPIVAVVAADDEERAKTAALAEADASRRAAGRPPIEAVQYPTDGHNLPRYRPADLAGVIAGLIERVAAG